MTNLSDKAEANKDLPPVESLKEELRMYKEFKSKDKGSYVILITYSKGYILSKKWHRTWKKYVGAVSRKPQNNKNWEPRVHPGPMTNEDILVSEDFYRSDDPEDVCNTPLKNSVKLRTDFKVITKQQWDFLYNLYGGTPIIKEMYNPEHCVFFKVDINFQKMNLTVFAPEELIDPDNLLKTRAMYIPQRWNIEQVKERIRKVLSQKEYGYNLSGEFRMWQLESLEDLNKIIKEVRPQLEDYKQYVTVNNTSTELMDTENSRINHNKDQQKENRTQESINNYSLSESKELKEGIKMIKKPVTDCKGYRIENTSQISAIEKLKLKDTDIILIEVADKDGNFWLGGGNLTYEGNCYYCREKRVLKYACICDNAYYCSKRCMEDNIIFHEKDCRLYHYKKKVKSSINKCANSVMGVCGLKNLGNTCFMNSGIQCLSNTMLLMPYFLEEKYVEEINKVNPLGMQGQIAREYANLLNKLWYGTCDSVSPSTFKKTLGEFRSTFKGHEQQDSQELITAILDGLHEDLNRVKDKPYVELKTSNDPDDNSIANESWYNYLARNQSVIVDLTHGQYKSVLKCPRCSRYSVTFDPFSMVTLPVPILQAEVNEINFFYIAHDLSKQVIKSSVAVDKKAKVKDLRVEIASELSVPMERLLIAAATENHFKKFLRSEEKVKDIMHYLNLCVYETDPRCVAKCGNKIQSNMMEEEKVPRHYMDQEMAKFDHNAQSYNLDGLPEGMIRVCLSIVEEINYGNNTNEEHVSFNRLIYIPKRCTMREVHIEVLHYLRPLFTRRNTNNQSDNTISQLSDEKLFAELFPNLTQENWQTELMSNNNYPYKLEFVRNTKASMSAKCVYCSKNNCNNCLVPFRNNALFKNVIKMLGAAGSINDYYNGNNNVVKLEMRVIFNQNASDWGVRLSRLSDIINISKRNITIARENRVTIYDCFRQFSSWEKLDQENMWYCSICEGFVEASKRMELLRCPPILIIHLKRFRVRNEVFTFRCGERINTLVDFPVRDLDLTGFTKNVEAKYDLYAISNHYGGTGGGHYVAFALNGDKWYQYDDSNVTEIKEAKLCSSAAYVLFYKRKDITPSTTLESLTQRVPETFKISEIKIKSKPNKSGNDTNNSVKKLSCNSQNKSINNY